MKKEQKIFNELIKDLKNGNFQYKNKEEKKINWSAYNEAQINEINLFLLFVREAINAIEKEYPKLADERETSPFDLAKIILIQQYFQVAERTASGLANLFKEKLNLSEVPSPRTIGRAYERRDVQDILKKIFERTSEPIKEIETSFSTDGTGLSTSIKKNYANDRDDPKKHKDYDKMLVMVSNNFHIVTSAVVLKGTAHESPEFKTLICETAEKFTIKDVEGDAAFLSRENCNLVAEVGGTPYFYPKEGTTLNQKGSPEWKKMLKSLMKDPQKWLEGFHLRSNSESYFSSYHRRFTKPLLKKKRKGRKIEALVRICVHNICMLIKAYFEHHIKVEEFSKDYI